MTPTTTPIRVLWLAKGLGRGGAEQLLVHVVDRLDRRQIEVEVAYVLPWKDALVEEFRRRGVAVHSLGASGRLGWVGALRALVRQERYDVIHTHAPMPAVVARLVAGRGSVLVHTEHNVWERYRPLTRWANALTYRRNRRVIAVSESVAASARRRGGRPPVEVVIHGIDARATRSEDRTGARARLGLLPEGLVVMTVGNLTVKKAHSTLLDAFVVVRARRGDARLVIVGDGPLRGELEQRVVDLGLVGAALLCGSRDDVADLLPAADVFVLSSVHEGLPIALVEALASGLPCVATAVGGVPEVIRDGIEGFLVEPGDVAGLAAAIEKLLGDAELRRNVGARARERAAAFDIGPAVERTRDIYRAAVGA